MLWLTSVDNVPDNVQGICLVRRRQLDQVHRQCSLLCDAVFIAQGIVIVSYLLNGMQGQGQSLQACRDGVLWALHS